MNYYVYTSKTDELTLKTKKKLKEELNKHGHVECEKAPKYIFTIGGDGTVLSAFKKFFNIIDSVYFVGIHTGKLGFYTDWLPDELPLLVKTLNENKQPRIAHYPLIEITLKRDDVEMKQYVLNEMTVVNPYNTQVLDIHINEDFFETFRGTGVCIATPGGSSAYNKSLGGAIVHPDIPIMQVTEIASINSNVYRTIGSPFILRDTDILKLTPHDLSRTALTFDNNHLDCGIFQTIECKIADKKLKFARLKDIKFWERVKRDFL